MLISCQILTLGSVVHNLETTGIDICHSSCKILAWQIMSSLRAGSLLYLFVYSLQCLGQQMFKNYFMDYIQVLWILKKPPIIPSHLPM